MRDGVVWKKAGASTRNDMLRASSALRRQRATRVPRRAEVCGKFVPHHAFDTLRLRLHGTIDTAFSALAEERCFGVTNVTDRLAFRVDAAREQTHAETQCLLAEFAARAGLARPRTRPRSQQLSRSCSAAMRVQLGIRDIDPEFRDNGRV
jgi:hypothetical protein